MENKQKESRHWLEIMLIVLSVTMGIFIILQLTSYTITTVTDGNISVEYALDTEKVPHSLHYYQVSHTVKDSIDVVVSGRIVTIPAFHLGAFGPTGMTVSSKKTLNLKGMDSIPYGAVAYWDGNIAHPFKALKPEVEDIHTVMARLPVFEWEGKRVICLMANNTSSDIRGSFMVEGVAKSTPLTDTMWQVQNPFLVTEVTGNSGH